MNAPGGGPDRTVTQTVPGGLLPPLPGLPFNQKIAAAGKVQLAEVTDYLARRTAGKPNVDPLATTQANYVLKMKKLGLGVTKLGKVYTLQKAAK
jgi:hypothetical protein